MSAGTVFLIAGIAAVFGFGRDIVGLLFKGRRMVSESKARADHEPYEMSTVILGNAKAVVDVQSALMIELKVSVEDEKKRRVSAEAELAAVRVELESTKQDLYAALLREHRER